jgi:hypothetical protein
MGCNIHLFPERKDKRGVFKSAKFPFETLDDRHYARFGFLAGVRNYADIPVLVAPRGLPRDSALDRDAYLLDHDYHTWSWFTVDELLAFDYTQQVENRRVTRKVNGIVNGGCTCEPGEGEMTTYMDLLGHDFVDELKAMKKAGIDRIVFCFDN